MTIPKMPLADDAPTKIAAMAGTLTISTEATATAKPQRALGYVRVATQQLADSLLDDQKVLLKEHYANRPVELVEIYSDYGVSGADDNRPGLQAMIAHALRPDSGITQIGLCGLDRLCRSDFLLNVYRRKLARAGVSIVAIT